MFKKLLLTSALVLAMQSPALAQDYNDGYDDPLTGAYVGVSGGYSWIDADSTAGDFDLNGDEYGVFVGYQIDQWLQNTVGMTGAIEAHYEWSNADDGAVEKDSSWGVQFRPGISFFESINPYAIIGYKRAEFEDSTGADEDHDGFELGIGTELVAYGDLGFRVDYTHTWYEDKGLTDFDPNEHALKAGVAYHF
tara:strand:- start:3583 stop:4161 length:579 start_codon:yes stop_codon:yes gene_type:complete